MNLPVAERSYGSCKFCGAAITDDNLEKSALCLIILSSEISAKQSVMTGGHRSRRQFPHNAR